MFKKNENKNECKCMDPNCALHSSRVNVKDLDKSKALKKDIIENNKTVLKR